ncbi:MAG TPA: hypothetical protein VFU46_09340 [Gemmatimonadales bacterium]|nr:hypothetical protein [Gemmatimonadales bacterium]
MPIERRVLLSLRPGERGRFQEALLAAGLVDQLVAPLAADEPLHEIDLPSDDAIVALTSAMAANGLGRPVVRRYWRPTPKELRCCELLSMFVWIHASGLPKPRREQRLDLGAACAECGAGLRPAGPARLRKREVPTRPPLGSVSGGVLLVHDELLAALEAERISGLGFERALDADGAPLPWHEARAAHTLAPMRVGTTGMFRGAIAGERPCGRCGRDGWFDDPAQPFTPSYGRDVLDGMPDAAETYELFGKGALREPLHASDLARPRLIVRRRVYELFRRLKLRGARFSPVALA